MTQRKSSRRLSAPVGYERFASDVSRLLEKARRQSARSVNAILTATYWEIGRRIVEQEQRGKQRAAYGEALLKRLAVDLTGRFGRGFSKRNLEQMRQFYSTHPSKQIAQTLSAQSGKTLASPSSFKGRLVQYVGRVLRDHPGKTKALVYDYVDSQVGVLKSMYYRRLKAYKILGAVHEEA